MNIIPVISDLLLHNQKAAIPGFGTFVVLQRPAQLNKVTRVLTPPSRVIRFDSKQQEDDGQLSGYLVQKLKQTRTDAAEAISRFAEDTAANLKDKGSVVLEGLGTLSRERAGDIAFSPDAELSQRITLFELPKLNIPAPFPTPEPVAKPEPVKPSPHIPPVAKVTREFPAPPSRNKRRWWIPAAILLVLAGLAGAVYYTGNYKSLIHDVKTKLSGNKPQDEGDKLVFGSTAGQDSARAGSDTLKEHISRELDERTSGKNALSYEEKKPVPIQPRVVNTPEPAHQIQGSSLKPYQIIAGAFLVPNNAERQKTQLEKKGLSPVILPKRGDYIMVSLGSYDTPEQADAAMRQFKEVLTQDLWVMRR